MANHVREVGAGGLEHVRDVFEGVAVLGGEVATPTVSHDQRGGLDN
jgi:hypothetical protein